jgi:hypothetical protein
MKTLAEMLGNKTKKPQKELYFDYLCSLVGNEEVIFFRIGVLTALHSVSFTEGTQTAGKVDENVVLEGRSLRQRYSDVMGVPIDDLAFDTTALEAMISVARRFSYHECRDTDGPEHWKVAQVWFWTFLYNAEIIYMDKDASKEESARLAVIKAIYDTYHGSGFFRYDISKQSWKVAPTMWWAMQWYLEDHHPELRF